MLEVLHDMNSMRHFVWYRDKIRFAGEELAGLQFYVAYLLCVCEFSILKGIGNLYIQIVMKVIV